MHKATKIWLMAAAALIVTGLMLFAGAMICYRWDFTKLSTEEFETNIYEVTEAFDSITIDADTADIVFTVSEDNRCHVKCHELTSVKHRVSVEDKELTVCSEDNRKWYEYIGISFHSPKVTVSLPQSEYTRLSICGNTGDIDIPNQFRFESTDISLRTGSVTLNASAKESVKISTTTGDIRIGGILAETLDLSVRTGDITLSDIRCKSILSNGNTGNISLKNVNAEDTVSIRTNTGDVKLHSTDAASIFIRTKTGEVSGSLLSEKIFVTDTSTGDVSVPTTTTGGKCEITTTTGDIHITLAEPILSAEDMD